MKSKIIQKYIITTISLLLNANSIASTFELPFVISICGYNNAPLVQKNLDSIFMQQYSNYRVVYIDDGSSDSTAAYVQDYIDTHQLDEKMSIIANSKRSRKMKNIYNFFHTCADEEIIIQVDGDDLLAHDQVFSLINQIYQTQDVWLTYGQFIGYPNRQAGRCKPVPDNIIAKRSFRSWEWVYTHLRTFHAWLFKNIKLEDFINELIPGFEGKFFPLANDAASYFPMLEMCGNKFAFISEVIYIYNWDSPLQTGKIENHLYDPAKRDLKSRAIYPQVQRPIINRLDHYENARADLIILSNTGPENVTILLNSISDKVTGIENIYVIHEQKNDSPNEYKQLEKIYSRVQSIPVLENQVDTELLNIINNCKQEHIILSHDTVCAVDSFDVHDCIIELERTFAYGFYFGFAHTELPFYSIKINKELISHQQIYQDMYTWKFKCEKGNPHYNHSASINNTLHNNLDMTLLRKTSLIERINKLLQTDNPQQSQKPNQTQKGTSTPRPTAPHALEYTNVITSFIDAWQKYQHQNMHNVGLFFETLKMQKQNSATIRATDNNNNKKEVRLERVQDTNLPATLEVLHFALNELQIALTITNDI